MFLAVAPKDRYFHPSRWAVALLGAALLLIIVVGMIRELTERWLPGEARMLGGG